VLLDDVSSASSACKRRRFLRARVAIAFLRSIAAGTVEVFEMTL
jgi:hypothetical protein